MISSNPSSVKLRGLLISTYAKSIFKVDEVCVFVILIFLNVLLYVVCCLPLPKIRIRGPEHDYNRNVDGMCGMKFKDEDKYLAWNI